MNKKIFSAIVLSSMLVSNAVIPFEASASTDLVETTNESWKKSVSNSLQNYLDIKITNGFSELQGYEIGKILKLKDKTAKETKYYVSVVDSNKETLGYAVLDGSNNYEVIEFGLGKEEPLKNVNHNVSYFGPLSYAEDVGNGKLQDLILNQEFDKQTLFNNLEAYDAELSTDEFEVSPATIINYAYKYINNVPDYQQSNNPSMNNDCVPTAGATIIMYWDANGYPNLSSSNNWLNVADRLGVLMSHNNSSGVNSSNVTSGMKSYFNEKGYTGFSVSRDTSPTFTDVGNIINAGHPSLLRLDNYKTIDPGVSGGHMVTLVGYETYYDTSTSSWYQQFIVHDNWALTGTQVWLKWSSEPVTDIWEVSN
ncbi:C39 family peptidase [Bacillus ndiopicus]|uniref:C39 family peptidase n=1 Tax=Bacillus ndiopicus TaxID=1347368 RepID=UPI0005A84346|nr:C39 family peptidase [Bacillus ndiopicus]